MNYIGDDDFMSTKRLLALGILVMILAGCAKKEASGIKVAEVMDRMKSRAMFENGKTEDMTSFEIAQRYGIDSENITEGLVYYNSDKDSADAIVLVKVKDKKVTEKIENALGREVTRLSDVWEGRKDENGAAQSKKIDRHVRKTRGDYVVLVICEEVKGVVKVFDELV